MAENVNLDRKLKLFALEYLENKNATKAAVVAGYSEKGASVTGSRLLANPKVQAIIAEKTAKIEDKYDISKERVMKQYARLAFYDNRKFYNEDGTLIPIHELDEDLAPAIVGLEVDEKYDLFGDASVKTKKLKLSDQKAALDSIAKMMGYNAAEKTEGKLQTIVTIERG